MTSWFVYISGENVELAKAEVHALLRQVSPDMKIQWKERLGIIIGTIDISKFIISRAALTQRVGRILYEADSLSNIIDHAPYDFWRNKIKSNETFSVKTQCINTVISLSKRHEIELELGAHIKTTTGAKVDLRNADFQVLVIVTDTGLLVCESIKSQLRPNLRRRAPGKKTFFHPSMMNSSLARIMCNLVGVKEGELVLDPFCGGGGILCEASYLGAYTVGVDLNWRLLIGARRNLEEISSKNSILQADAQNLPISSVDRIVTDPPYGRASSTRGVQSTKLVEELLKEVDSVIQLRGERVCICSSTEMNLPQLVKDYGFELGQDLRIYVHRGLMREIVTIIL